MASGPKLFSSYPRVGYAIHQRAYKGTSRKYPCTAYFLEVGGTEDLQSIRPSSPLLAWIKGAQEKQDTHMPEENKTLSRGECDSAPGHYLGVLLSPTLKKFELVELCGKHALSSFPAVMMLPGGGQRICRRLIHQSA